MNDPRPDSRENIVCPGCGLEHGAGVKAAMSNFQAVERGARAMYDASDFKGDGEGYDELPADECEGWCADVRLLLTAAIGGDTDV